mgnify:CR=1 FL=1
MTQSWCESVGIDPPDLADVVARKPRLSTFRRMVAALLEHGAPMTLDEVAARFEAVGLGPAAASRRSLSRCRPGSRPVFREGEHYGLDLHDEELRFLVAELGLSPASAPAPAPRPEPEGVPGPEVPLSPAELDEGWNDRSLLSWSQTRVVLAVLDAHGGPRSRDEVAELVSRRTTRHSVGRTGAQFGRAGAAVTVDERGRWMLAEGAEASLRAMRDAVRVWVMQERARRAARPDPTDVAARVAARAKARAARGEALAVARRFVLVAFPPRRPQAVALLDIRGRRIDTFVGDELAHVDQALVGAEAVGAVNARATMAALGLSDRAWQLLELGPPKKTRRLNRQGRTLRITPELLIQGTCGIHRPFGDPKKLSAYLAAGHHGKLRRRLAANVKSLYALYAYGMLHGAVRLRWGFLDELMGAPWTSFDEPRLYDVMTEALENRGQLEVVAGASPGWAEPWSRAQRATVVDWQGWPELVGVDGVPIPREDVQAVRWASKERG